MLFDEIERTETRRKRERESTFGYLNSSARTPMTAARAVLEQWFDSYPESGMADLRARFRSPIDAQHQSAFWELYLHELFSRLGLTLEPHPEIQGSRNHPDFLVKEGDVAKFYLEGIVAGLPSAKDSGAEARLAEVFDLVNSMEISDWFLQVEYRGYPEAPPSVKELRKQLESWLASLDVKAIDAALKAEEWESLPEYEWQCDGLTLTFTPSPKSPKAAANADSQPIGITMPAVGNLLTTDNDIRRAVEAKAKKYGTLPLPLVVAVNVVSEHCDNIDVNNALFGTEQIVCTLNADGSIGPERAERRHDGVWFGPKGPRNKAVSAILIGNDVGTYNCADEDKTPLLIHSPHPTHLLALEYPLPESLPDNSTGTMKRKDGRSARDFLRLPDPWPPAYD
ncbi:MAG: hypothetical protein WCF22_15525 [Candidatus Sulfotelmatobacter sp.]